MKARFRIVEFTNPSGATVYRVDGKDKDGLRVRKNFKTGAEAIAEKQRLEIEVANLPAETPMLRTTLTPPQAKEAERAFAELAGKSLTEAVRFYLENYRDPINKRLFADAVPEFTAAKRLENLRPDSIRNLNGRLGLFSKMHPGKLVSDILPDTLRDFLNRPGVSPRGKINDRAALSNFFNWAWKEKRYCDSNPTTVVKRPATDETKPKILSLSDARKLIETAATFKDGKLVPYVALCLFCAIRPDGEIDGLTWDHIDLKARTISVTGEIAKLRGVRDVEISKNCVEWLKPHALKRTPFVAANWRKDWDALRELCGFGTADENAPNLKPWVQDYLRHTAITYHLGKTDHEGKTALWAGNSPEVVQQYYRGRGVKKPDIKAFWSIKPTDAALKIVALKAA